MVENKKLTKKAKFEGQKTFTKSVKVLLLSIKKYKDKLAEMTPEDVDNLKKQKTNIRKKLLHDMKVKVYNHICECDYQATLLSNDLIKRYYVEYDNLKNKEERLAFDRKLYAYSIEKYDQILGSILINQIIRNVSSLYKSNRYKIQQGERHLTNFTRKKCNLHIYHNTYNLELCNANRIKITLSVGGINNPLHRLEFKSILDRYQKNIIEKIIKQEYIQGQAKIQIKDDEIFLIISYSFAIKNDKNLDPNICIGADLGIKNPLVIAVNNSYDRFYYPEQQINEVWYRLEQRKKKLLKTNYKLLHEREGHGRKRKMQILNKFSEKFHNYQTTENHRIARALAEYAYKKNAKYIILEDLRNFRFSDSKFFKVWGYRQFDSFVISAASDYGIEVRFAFAGYTSRTCPSCGYRDDSFTFKYRKDNNMPKFNCKKCGKSYETDYMAAKNLSLIPINKTLSSEDWMKGEFLKKEVEDNLTY